MGLEARSYGEGSEGSEVLWRIRLVRALAIE